MTASPNIMKPDFNGIPDELKALPQWVLWRGRRNGDRLSKVPYQVDGSRAKSNDPATWTDFNPVRRAYEDGRGHGVGFMFSEGGGLVGVDLDHCINEAGELSPLAASIIGRLNSYTEFSVSGRGLHVLVRAELAEGKRRGPVEIYPHGRFFVITGGVWGEAKDIRPAQAEVERLVSVIARGKKKSQAPSTGTPQYAYLRNDELIERAKNAANGAKFSRLWNGDTSDHPSPSEADCALLTMLLYWTHGDEARALMLFGESGLGQRDKWTGRADYRRRTLNAARACLSGQGVSA